MHRGDELVFSESLEQRHAQLLLLHHERVDQSADRLQVMVSEVLGGSLVFMMGRLSQACLLVS